MKNPREKAIGAVVAIVGVAFALMNSPPARSQSLLPGTIADNDSLFVDGRAFTVTPGRAKGAAAALIDAPGIRALGPGAVIFRSGQKLYIADAPMVLPGAQNGGKTIYLSDSDRPNRIAIEYVPPKNPDFQEIYTLLRERHVLETLQQIFSPFRLGEPLKIITTECGQLNAWYSRETGKPVLTLCYDLLEHFRQSLPKDITPAGITRTDAAAGQFFWLATHEMGHAMFDFYDVPIFGHQEDAADDFAAYIMLQFGKERARRLIGGAAWQFKEYISDYRTKPQVKLQLAAFSSNHGQPEERFYNLMCMAYGADPVTFADLTQDGYLPPNRSPTCKYEYDTLAYAFQREITPHIDLQMARAVLDNAWLPKQASSVRVGQQ
jgi:hypothetical protein